MLRGLMVVNAFLNTAKFEELYSLLEHAARQKNIDLIVRTNAELCCRVSFGFPADDYDFCLFWDKDVQLAKQLEQSGLRLFNPSDAILNCDDKALTYLQLKKHHISMPKTILAPKTFPNSGYPNLRFVEEAADLLGFPLVLKQCFGSFGSQVYLMRNLTELKEKVVSLAGIPLLFQEFISESSGHDTRINVVGGHTIAAILRSSTDGDFRSNLTRGGSMRPYSPTAEECALAERVTSLLNLDFAGCDILFGKNGPVLCEVNSNAHFKTTLACTGINMADFIMNHIAEAVG